MPKNQNIFDKPKNASIKQRKTIPIQTKIEFPNQNEIIKQKKT